MVEPPKPRLITTGMDDPSGLTFGGPNNHLFVALTGADQIKEYTTAGALTGLQTFGSKQIGGAADPISALTALLGPDGALDHWCHFCYELRLHRARGYGALKAILDVLAEDEPLTLTEISQRLHRTPGSTKDYLSWLEDVDLVTANHKRYSFADPLLRLWVRLHCRPTPPAQEEVAREACGSFKRTRFFKQMGCAFHNLQRNGRAHLNHRIFVHADHGDIIAADDHQGRGLHVRQRRARQIAD